MNQSSTSTDNTAEMPNTTYDMAIRYVKNRTTIILRGANRYGVLEDSDNEECMNNKVQNVRFDNMRDENLENLIFIKTVKQPSGGLSNMFANIVVREPCMRK